MADANSPWERIQQGVTETERLIGQKQYNMAMIKSRQTLEIMVKCLAEKALILDGSDMSEIIDQLYESKWITKKDIFITGLFWMVAVYIIVALIGFPLLRFLA